MCTYQTDHIVGRGQRQGGRRAGSALTDATVYFDHPVHAPAEHTLNIDLLESVTGARSRVAVELDPGSARALAEAILDTLDTVPAVLLEP